MYNSRYFNIALLLFGAIGGAGCAFVLQVFLARILTAEEFGVYTSTLALTMLLSPIAHFGLGQFLLKESYKKTGQYKNIIKPLQACLFSTFGITILVFIVCSILLQDNILFVVLMSGHILSQVCFEIMVSLFQINKNSLNLSILQGIHHMLRLFLAIAALYIFDIEGLVLAGLAYFLVGLILLCALSYYATHEFSRVKGKEKLSNGSSLEWKKREIIKGALPYGLSTLAYFIYFQSDIFMIESLDSSYSAGIYSTAFTIMTALYLFPAIVFDRYFLPHFHRLSYENNKNLYNIYLKSTLILFSVGVAIALCIYSTGDLIITYMFGEKYSAAAKYLDILSIGVPMMLTTFCAGALLATKDNAKYKLYVMILAAASNVALNLYYIPTYSATAAAWSTVISQIILAVGFAIFVWKDVFKNEE